MNATQKEKAVNKIKSRIREIEEQLKDVSRVDWWQLVNERNSLSVNLKGMKNNPTKYKRKKPYMNTVSVKQWGV
jgi:hypothetical protein